MRLRRVDASAHQHDADFRLPTRGQLAVGLGYAAAAALFIVIGVIVNDFMLSVFEGIAYLLVVVWLVPLAVRLLR